MEFITLEDETGLAECTIFPRPYRRLGGLLRGAGPHLVRGVVEDRLGAVTLRIEEAKPAAEPISPTATAAHQQGPPAGP